MEKPVITVQQLKVKASMENCLIIVASFNEFEDIIEVLKYEKIKGYICTWYGVQSAIQLNFDNERFPLDFRKTFERRAQITKTNYHLSYLLETYSDLAMSYTPVIVYQPAKVGSSTICSTLNAANIENVHIHYLMDNSVKIKELPKDFVDLFTQYSAILREKILNSKENVKIITLVREPISRAASWFMEWFDKDCVVRETDYKIDVALSEFVKTQLESNYEFEWFDKEIKELTGIDIFMYPFDKEKGCSWIKVKNIEILILKMEKISDNLDMLESFVGCKLKLQSANVGLQKHYKYIYEELRKNFRISKEDIEKHYIQNSKLNHFYSLEEKNGFLEKWKNNIEE